MESPQLLHESMKIVIHEFVGDRKFNTHHYNDLFMNQELCNLRQLPEFYCTMADLLYKYHDHKNPSYLGKYLSVMPDRVPDIVCTYLYAKNIDIEDISLVGLEDHIIIALHQKCLVNKMARSLKKQLKFD